MNEQKSFWVELRSRHVVRAAVAHVVFFWLLAQIAETVLPYIGVVDEPVMGGCGWRSLVSAHFDDCLVFRAPLAQIYDQSRCT